MRDLLGSRKERTESYGKPKILVRSLILHRRANHALVLNSLLALFHLATEEIVALKQIKFDLEMTREGFPVTALREISVLLSLSHENVVSVREMVVGSSFDKVFMVMEVSKHIVAFVTRHQMLCLFLSLLLFLVYGNGLEGSNETNRDVTLSSIGTQEHAASNIIGDESYTPKVVVAS